MGLRGGGRCPPSGRPRPRRGPKLAPGKLLAGQLDVVVVVVIVVVVVVRWPTTATSRMELELAATQTRQSLKCCLAREPTPR